MNRVLQSQQWERVNVNRFSRVSCAIHYYAYLLTYEMQKYAKSEKFMNGSRTSKVLGAIVLLLLVFPLGVGVVDGDVGGVVL